MMCLVVTRLWHQARSVVMMAVVVVVEVVVCRGSRAPGVDNVSD